MLASVEDIPLSTCLYLDQSIISFSIRLAPVVIFNFAYLVVVFVTTEVNTVIYHK
jgi:hypothetical protein